MAPGGTPNGGNRHPHRMESDEPDDVDMDSTGSREDGQSDAAQGHLYTAEHPPGQSVDLVNRDWDTQDSDAMEAVLVGHTVSDAGSMDNPTPTASGSRTGREVAADPCAGSPSLDLHDASDIGESGPEAVGHSVPSSSRARSVDASQDLGDPFLDFSHGEELPSTGSQHSVSPRGRGHPWRREPASIDEPLVMLMDGDSPDSELQLQQAARLREELAEARAASKADRAALDDVRSSLEALERERDSLHDEGLRLVRENRHLRVQLEDHHGIMARDWAQTLGFQERLRDEEAIREQLETETNELREDVRALTEKVGSLKEDASRWRMFTCATSMADATSDEFDAMVEVCLPAVSRLQLEMRERSRRAQNQLHNELEQQLCVICRDARKTVLFTPCNHICVCEACRSRLQRDKAGSSRSYRCPMCKEPVVSYVARVHF